MFYNVDLLKNLAKRIAIVSVERANPIAEKIGSGSNHTEEITGSILGVMPHLAEKAILTNTYPGQSRLKRLENRF